MSRSERPRATANDAVISGATQRQPPPVRRGLRRLLRVDDRRLEPERGGERSTRVEHVDVEIGIGTTGQAN